jgi:hypothetical protein
VVLETAPLHATWGRAPSQPLLPTNCLDTKHSAAATRIFFLADESFDYRREKRLQLRKPLKPVIVQGIECVTSSQRAQADYDYHVQGRDSNLLTLLHSLLLANLSCLVEGSFLSRPRLQLGRNALSTLTAHSVPRPKKPCRRR